MRQSPTLVPVLNRHFRLRFAQLSLLIALQVMHAWLAPRPAFAADRGPAAGVGLSGQWNAGPMVERWNIGDWADACGPRPAARDLPGSLVSVKEDGAELIISGGGRTFRTSECWDQNPGVSRGSHSVSERAWRTRCNSAPSDPKQTTLVTSVTATDSTITLDETGEYQFRIQGQNCAASVRRSRTMSLVQRLGEAPVESPAASAAAAVEATAGRAGNAASAASSTAAAASAKVVNRCAVVGEAVRIEVRPARKILRPGERFAFRTLAWDANGCAADARGSWSVLASSSKVTIAGATIAVADDATDGSVDLAVAFAGKSARVVVDVATPARYDALLATASHGDGGGESDDTATTLLASGNLGTSTAVAQDGARSRKTTFVSIIGSLALGLAGLGFVLLRRNAARRRQRDVKRQGDGEEKNAPGYGIANAGGPERERMNPARPRGPALRKVVCPACGSEFPGGSTFCPHDGNRLGPPPVVSFQGPSPVVAGGVCPTCGRAFEPGITTCPTHGDDLVPAALYRATAQQAPHLTERGKICPSCGGRYTAPASFCGKDGTALVLVN